MSEEKDKLKLDELEKKIEECEKLKNEYLADWQRERADFLNYKKEEMERIEGFLKYAGTEFILKILPILDNFELAEKKLSDELKKDESIKGILQIKKQVFDFLKNLGIEPIDCLGKKFDPNFHEAIEEVPTDLSAEARRAKAEAAAKAGVEVKESGIIIEEVRKGYKLHGRLLRPAKVRVSK